MKVVYNSFHGRYSDSPRAVFERLLADQRVQHVWLADPAHIAGFPASATTVDIESSDAVAVLEGANLLVANTHTELEWCKHQTLTYVQTWHGTPLKRIHRDVLWAPPGRLDRLDRDVAKWDILLSPNPESTPRLRAAFRYHGELLEIGYPRNDILSHPDSEAQGAKLRSELDIPDAVTVVLYTPTWRDDEAFREGSPKLGLALALKDLTDALGPQYCLLVRVHPSITGRTSIPALPAVRDVSWYPDVRDLYLAADILVSDYSSTIFDFAITGKPMIFYAYDLDRFRDTVRGFYFDFVPVAPGPVVHTQAELLAALADPAILRNKYADAYAAFVKRFCTLADGHATDRLLAHLGLLPT